MNALVSTKLAVEMTWLKACFDPDVNAQRIYCVLTLNKLKKEKREQYLRTEVYVVYILSTIEIENTYILDNTINEKKQRYQRHWLNQFLMS